MEEDEEEGEKEEMTEDCFPTNLFFKCVFQTFFISLSVLPGKCDAICDHLQFVSWNKVCIRYMEEQIGE